MPIPGNTIKGLIPDARISWIGLCTYLPKYIKLFVYVSLSLCGCVPVCMCVFVCVCAPMCMYRFIFWNSVSCWSSQILIGLTSVLLSPPPQLWDTGRCRVWLSPEVLSIQTQVLTFAQQALYQPSYTQVPRLTPELSFHCRIIINAQLLSIILFQASTLLWTRNG